MHRRAFLLAITATVLWRPRPAFAQQILATGTFRDGDPVHRGSGDMRIVTDMDGPRVEMRNMEIVPGPNLLVYLVAEPDPLFPEDVEAKFLSLGKLKSLTGDQDYGVPADADLGAWGSVVVWCDTFKTAFAVATIERI